MFTVISRIIYYGFKNFQRNSWLSITTIIVMVLALFVFHSLIIFQVITQGAINSIQDKIDISAYFKSSTPEDEILNIKQALSSLPEVKNIDYVSRDQALANFKALHQNDQTIIQALNEVSSNPLEASLNIKAQNPSQYASIADYLNNPNIASYIDTVSYAKNQTIIDRLRGIISTISRLGLLLTLILALIAIAVAFNTVRLAIYSNRDEINIMRLVGASNILVRGPYVVEGIICGVIAAVASIVVAWPFIYFISPYLLNFIPGLNLIGYFYSNIIPLALYQLLFGIFIGGLSSLIAVQRYLKN
ncbi:MAG: permease-like cell division protein FtsX [Patescibacteria group bacterium]|nr:permease-like cell division protein FtsX [Patescibacteria group bacterium]